jgi:hypothetical protein
VAGEELPPVVATLEGNDASFLAMLERDIEAARVFAADLQAALTEGFGGLTVSGAQVSSEGVATAGEAIGEELSAGIVEGAAGLDLSPEVERSLEAVPEAALAVGSAAGEQLTLGVQSAASGLGEQVAQEIGAPLTAGLAEAGASGGAALGSELVASTESVGSVLGRQISEQLRLGLDEAAQATMGVLGQINATGFGSSLASSAAGAGFLAKLTSNLSDAAAEAGGAAGVELSRNLSEAAVTALSEADFAAFTDQLVATASAAGGEAGVAAAESLGTGLATALPGVDLIAEGLSTIGESMSAGARAAGQAAAEELAQVEEATLTGAQAYEAELDAVFEAIYRDGSGMTARLAAAMTEAFQGIETDTAGFGAAELRLFDEFFQTLETQGDQAALALAERMRLVSQAATSGADLMGTGVSTAGLPTAAAGAESAGPQVAVPGLAVASEAKAAASATEEVGAAARTADAAVGGMAATMGGPWMWGILGAVSILPMFSGLLGNSSQVAQQAAQAQAQLGQAVSQDSNMIGANTVATIANQLATSGAADSLQGYGISLSDATAAMAGVKSAQQDVNGTLNEQITNLQALITEQEAHATSGNAEISTEKQQLEQLQATQQAMQQLERDVVNAVAQQNELTEATLNAEKAADVFAVQVRAGVLSLQQQAQSADVSAQAMGAYLMTLTPGTQAYTNAVNDQVIALAHNAVTAGINAQALNDSLPPQAQLSQAALNATVDYQEASAATSAYTSAVNALYGQYGQASNAQAAFTIGLDGLKGNITSGKDAVNLMTDAGAKNFEAFNSVATAAENAAEKIYQTSGSADQADRTLQTMATQLDKSAAQAGLTKEQVRELNLELFGVPDVKNITIHLNKSPAEIAMDQLHSFINSEINDINNTPITPHVSGRNIAARAGGGPVSAGTPYWVGENLEPEVFVPGADGFITPMDMLQPVGAATGVGGGSAGSAGAPVVVVGDVYLDGQKVGRLVTPQSRSSALQYKTRNSRTGFN